MPFSSENRLRGVDEGLKPKRIKQVLALFWSASLFSFSNFFVFHMSSDRYEWKWNFASWNESTDELSSCALLFFGLPRSFQSLSLPSIRKNVLFPNARYHCDVFVHWYNVSEEASGRLNEGGRIHPSDIFLLEAASREAFASTIDGQLGVPPMISFVSDTEEQFWSKRGKFVQKYRNTTDESGRPLYFPWKNGTYYDFPRSLDNIVRQWHSLEAVWGAMRHGRKKYGRVGMFRSDAFYLSPIDIYQLEKGKVDTNNHFALIPPFAKFPVSDRMFYGPYDPVRIWATKRFEKIDEHVRTNPTVGMGMHSETFLNTTLLPFIEKETGVRVAENPDVCFLRTRPNNVIIMNDCELKGKGVTRGMERIDVRRAVEEMTGLSCQLFKMERQYKGLRCRKTIAYN
mmetsp:Transcript_17367/g.37937  ORF Transcript_17367/g.37937 Transcript_17367/m.37937 type:complete len:399 (-) Transcript_17367:986-2182(-)